MQSIQYNGCEYIEVVYLVLFSGSIDSTATWHAQSASLGNVLIGGHVIILRGDPMPGRHMLQDGYIPIPRS